MRWPQRNQMMHFVAETAIGDGRDAQAPSSRPFMSPCLRHSSNSALKALMPARLSVDPRCCYGSRSNPALNDTRQTDAFRRVPTATEPACMVRHKAQGAAINTTKTVSAHCARKAQSRPDGASPTARYAQHATPASM